MVDAWEFLARALQRSGKTDEALAAYQQALKVSNGSPQIAVAAASLYFDLGRLDEAETHAKMAVATHPSFAHGLLAQIALQRNDLDLAEKEARAAMDEKSLRLGPMITLAEVLHARKDDAGALDLTRKAAELYNQREAKDPELIRGLALIHGKLLADQGDAAGAESRLQAGDRAVPRQHPRLLEPGDPLRPQRPPRRGRPDAADPGRQEPVAARLRRSGEDAAHPQRPRLGPEAAELRPGAVPGGRGVCAKLGRRASVRHDLTRHSSLAPRVGVHGSTSTLEGDTAVETLMQDLRYSVRTLLKSPGFATIAVLCIAIGIGANTSIFSVVNAILLRPFPYADPDRIVALHEIQPKNDIDAGGFSNLDYRDLREQATAFSSIAAYTERSLTFSGEREPERVSGASISWNLFPFLGVKPALGRTFRADEDRAGAPGAVLLSHELWMRRFNGDPNVVGKTILVNAAAHTVVGVMPPRFGFPEKELAWVPLRHFVKDDPRAERNLTVLGRLKPGSSLEQARAEVKAIVERIAKQNPDTHTGWSGNVRSLREEFIGKETAPDRPDHAGGGHLRSADRLLQRGEPPARAGHGAAAGGGGARRLRRRPGADRPPVPHRERGDRPARRRAGHRLRVLGDPLDRGLHSGRQPAPLLDAVHDRRPGSPLHPGDRRADRPPLRPRSRRSRRSRPTCTRP